jgi:hypothetical protein
MVPNPDEGFLLGEAARDLKPPVEMGRTAMLVTRREQRLDERRRAKKASRKISTNRENYGISIRYRKAGRYMTLLGMKLVETVTDGRSGLSCIL